MPCKNFTHPGLIGNVGDNGANQGPTASRNEVLFGLIEQRLALIEHDETTRVAERDLPADFLADATSCTRDEHGAAGNHCLDGGVIELRGRPT